MSVELPVFLSEPSAAGSYNWLPAPLGCNLAKRREHETVENSSKGIGLLLHDNLLSVAVKNPRDPQ
jgi:hypothetical protein